MKSRRVVINDKEDVAIEEVELGELQPGQIRIRTEYSLISAGTELSRVFKLKEGAKYPAYPGYCSTGIVLQSNIEGFREGDHVLFSGPHADLHNFDPLHSDGSILYRLDPSTDMKKAPYMVMCWIALNGILPADVKIGDTVAVFGLGTLGILVSLYYQMAGCRVIGFEPSEVGQDWLKGPESGKSSAAPPKSSLTGSLSWTCLTAWTFPLTLPGFPPALKRPSRSPGPMARSSCLVHPGSPIRPMLRSPSTPFTPRC